MQKINWHSLRMIAMILIIFISGGLTALNGHVGSLQSVIDTVMPWLLFGEHMLAGNTVQ